MRGERLSDAIAYDKLNLLKKDFAGYIRKNTEKVDANLPVFYGHVISALDNSFPGILDETYDEFIDHITFEVLNASRNGNDFGYITRVVQNALRSKKGKDAESGINIVVGLKLAKDGDCLHAIDFLKKYRSLDAKIGTTLAYCYLELSRLEFRGQDAPVRPGEMELLARETLIDLARSHPPVNLARQLDLEDPSFLEKIFWQMIFLGLEWFPAERWFIEAGLENAALTNDADMRKRLLDISSERFYNDIHFLRTMFYYYLDKRDSGGAAGVLNHLIRQYPDDLEPIYLGLKFSLLTRKKITYHSFRKLASTKGMPLPVVYLFDLAFSLLNRENGGALAAIAELEKEAPHLRFYTTTLRYLADGFLSGDEKQVRKARKALLESVDQFSLGELRRGAPAGARSQPAARELTPPSP